MLQRHSLQPEKNCCRVHPQFSMSSMWFLMVCLLKPFQDSRIWVATGVFKPTPYSMHFHANSFDQVARRLSRSSSSMFTSKRLRGISNDGIQINSHKSYHSQYACWNLKERKANSVKSIILETGIHWISHLLWKLKNLIGWILENASVSYHVSPNWTDLSDWIWLEYWRNTTWLTTTFYMLGISISIISSYYIFNTFKIKFQKS